MRDVAAKNCLSSRRKVAFRQPIFHVSQALRSVSPMPCIVSVSD